MIQVDLLLLRLIVVDIAYVGCVHLEHHGAHLAHPALCCGVTHIICHVLTQKTLFLLSPIAGNCKPDRLRSISEEEVEQAEDKAYDGHYI